ncbi:MAG: bifunctional diaminohydroxyphosphoribosylaminopyrimidine deaminase/5-amino-6-(5-phosphoribosylamino)uracil reductase RibD [Bacteroidales bacterium]|nr:bifunctional diaminohydroxyphosphoribosylaminopyrimidine deaminase/5-amino-6-(5-phosphoribosylamino)uracil reductase RibD [Bacteroidales bacterium]
MQRSLQLARLGKGTAAPNPMVGSVIVFQGEIIGEGYHQQCGQAHAEVNAINSVIDSDLLTQSTLYVNLEPCAHVGRTPACSTLIIQKKIPRVVIGCVDPFEKVAGKGIDMLKAAGVEVVVGVLEKESQWLNRCFFTFHQKKRPYIILKWAQTIDGFIDIDRTDASVEPAWITNELSRALVHKWRTEEPAIMVGTQTALKDNPQLNVRAWSGKEPLRITVDRDLRIPRSYHLYDDSQATLIFSNEIGQSGKNTEWVKLDNAQDINRQIFTTLYQKEIQSVIVEGGKEVLESLIAQNLWDEARVFIGPKTFKKGVKAPIIDAKLLRKEWLNDTELSYFIPFD